MDIAKVTGFVCLPENVVSIWGLLLCLLQPCVTLSTSHPLFRLLAPHQLETGTFSMKQQFQRFDGNTI